MWRWYLFYNGRICCHAMWKHPFARQLWQPWQATLDRPCRDFLTCNSVVWRTPGHGWRDKERGLNQHDAKKMKEETVKIRALLVALLVDMVGRWVPVGSIGCLIPGGRLIPWWLNFPRGRSLERIAILILISMEMALQNIRSGSAIRRGCLSGIEIKMGSCWWMQRFSTYGSFSGTLHSLLINASLGKRWLIQHSAFLLMCPLRRRYVLIYLTVSGKILQLISDFLKWLHLIKTSGVSISVSHFSACFYLLSGS